MGAANRPHPRYRHTYEAYLVYERDNAHKHEFDGGEIFAMAGGTPRHNALAARVSAARGRDCVTFQSDQRVRILATGRATYPDASVVCGPLDLDRADPSRCTITNPRLIVEVLSPSTEQEDRGNKWHDYQRLASLEQYVLVSQTGARVERFRRQLDGS